MTCTSCKHWNLREAGKMAAQGFGLCDFDAKWIYYSIKHKCSRHKALDADKVNARIVWLDKQKG